jgi:hypothetical protein
VTDGCYYPARRGIVLSIRPNSRQFSLFPSTRGLSIYFTLALLHELTHWAMSQARHGKKWAWDMFLAEAIS